MPKNNWFHHIPLGVEKRRKKDTLRKCYNRGGDETSLRKAPTLSTYYKIGLYGSTKIRSGNYLADGYTLQDIAKIFNVHANTVRSWHIKGMLPEPYKYSFQCYRNWGWQNKPIYTKQQVLVICQVLNDIFGQCTQFRQSHTQHIAMMQDGSTIALRRISYKAAKPNSPQIEESKTPLRKRPAPHLRPFLRQIQISLKR